MIVKELETIGFPGYRVSDGGWLYKKNGEYMRGNANGQVRLSRGPGEGAEWVSIAWVIAKAFIPEIPGCIYVRCKDGDAQNTKVENLEWSPTPVRNSRKQAWIIQELNSGLTPEQIHKETKIPIGYIRNVAGQRLKDLKMIEELRKSQNQD